MNRKPGLHAGYTLLEVMIALLVFSIGLLGMAAMMVSAVRGNHQAYHHSQATYIADSIADGLRGNLAAVNSGGYDTGGFISTHGGSSCSPCAPEELAARNLQTWAAMAANQLPGGEINIDCDQIAAPIGPVNSGFNGICHLRLRWVESGDIGQQDETAHSQFSWMVQP